METRSGTTGWDHRRSLLLAVLVLGSIWGASEVLVNQGIRASGLPLRAGILTGIGVGLMAIAVGAFRRPAMLPLVALVAILCKQMVVPILHVSVMCKANSCVAVGLQALGLTGTAYLAGRHLHRSLPIRMASAGSAALAAAGVFYFVGMGLEPCAYLLSFNRAGGFAAFMGTEGLAWAAFSAVLFPLGYRMGARIREGVPALERRPALAYLGTAALVAGSWTAAALAISAGF